MTEPTNNQSVAPTRDSLTTTASINLKRTYLKMGLIALFVGICVVIVQFTPLKEIFTDFERTKAAIHQAGLWAPLFFLGITALSIFVGAPRLPFCLLGGALFGFIEGLVLAQVGALGGAYGPYLFGRFGARNWVEKKLQRFRAIRKQLKNPTVLNVFLFRQLPIWGLFSNLLLGSIGVRHVTFMLGSFLGFLPQAVIFTLMGSGIVEKSAMQALSRIWAAIPILLIIAWLTWRFLRKR